MKGLGSSPVTHPRVTARRVNIRRSEPLLDALESGYASRPETGVIFSLARMCACARASAYMRGVRFLRNCVTPLQEKKKYQVRDSKTGYASGYAGVTHRTDRVTRRGLTAPQATKEVTHA